MTFLVLQGLKMLNAVGCGQPASGLALHLVYHKQRTLKEDLIQTKIEHSIV
jgi:hypothetical protein